MGYVHRPLASAPTGTAGVVEATLAVPAAFDLLVERLFISTNSTTPTSLTVYVGDAVPTNRRSYTSEGDLNELEANPPMWVPAGSVLRLVWEGGTAPAGTELAAVAGVQGQLVAPGA